MGIHHWFDKRFLQIVDALYAGLPRDRPNPRLITKTKIISHRGEYDNKTVFENTIPAFERVAAAGVWGMEFDVRWSKDLTPVVFHDADFYRLFGQKEAVRRLTLEQIQNRFPHVPTLAAVINAFGKTMHLMVEIKAEHYPDPVRQNRILKDLFSGLIPKKDFHILSLSAPMFDYIECMRPDTFLLISELNVRAQSGLALKKGYGGLLGHYLFIRKKRIRKHVQNGQRVGTGYIASKNCLLREINRGVTWFFSNRAAKIQRILNTL